MILVVDDEPAVLEYVRATLENAGYEVADASSAEEALGLLDQFRPDALLTDIVLPGRNGLWLAAHFHRLEPGIPVLFMSGFTEDYLDELSGSVCLSKPFTPSQLVTAVVDLIGAAHPARRA